jgi:hypothetical protein
MTVTRHSEFRGRAHAPLSVLTLLVAFLGAAELEAQCTAPCTDATKACVCVLDPADAPVSLTPLGTVQRQPARVGQPLSPGDQLLSTRPDAIAELTCPGGSEVKLHGAFHAVIRPTAQGQDCVFDLLAGNADVLGVKPTQGTVGETVMGSSSTQYGIRVRRTGNALNVECLVFEGEAEVKYANRWSRVLKDTTKSTWSQGRGDPLEARVVESDIRATSGVYARADLARRPIGGQTPADRRALLNELTATYTAVMARPRDPQARILLAALQTNLRNSKQVLYHLQRAEKEPTRNEQKIDIAIMKYAALKQTGRDTEANVEIEKVRQLDPTQYEKLRLADPAAIRATPRKPQ